MKLLPCPFCGDPKYIQLLQLDRSNWEVFCEKCKCGQSYFTSKDVAIEWWNTRAKDPRLTTAIKMIRMAMTGNKDYNAGLVKALLILDEQFEEE